MTIKFNTVSFCRENYKEFYDALHKYDYNYDAMWDDVKEFVRIAIKNGYQLKIWSDETTVVVEYNYKDPSLSEATIEWVGEDEYIDKYARTEEQ